MAATLADVYQKAEADLMAQKYEDALRGYVAALGSAPKVPRLRMRVADTLLNLGDMERAKAVYKALAWHYIKSGQPLLGLVVCKMLLAIDPTYEDVLYILAELYSSASDRVGEIEIETPPELDGRLFAPALPGLLGDALREEARRRAADAESATVVPDQLPMIPLFSHLTEDAFIKVLGSLRLKRYADGEKIIREGEVGDSVFMLADGVVVVSKKMIGQDVTLANLHQGAVFGEMALVSKLPRTATVTAKGEVALLALSRHDLEVHAGELQAVTHALRKFTRSRFLANLAATSPFFADLNKADRRELLRKFQSKLVGPGDIVIEEGEDGRGLYLVLRGDLEVSRKTKTEAVKLATLKSGDVFGEMSLLRDAPTNATVTSRAAGEVLFLPKEEFKQAVQAHPQVHRTLNTLSTARLQANRLSKAGELITDDAKVMV